MHENSPILLLGFARAVDELFDQVFEQLIVNLKLAFERPVGHSTAASEHLQRGVDKVLEVHLAGL